MVLLQCGEIDEAQKFFKVMLIVIVAWNDVIDGYAKSGHGDKVVALYQDMNRETL